MAFLLLVAGCTEVGSKSHSVSAATWQPEALPESPPPMPLTLPFFGLLPPRYPENERHAGIYGDVLLVLTVDAAETISEWKIVRATSEGYAREVARSFRTRRGLAPKVPAGTYSFGVAYCGDLEGDSRPGVFWVGADPFGR